MRPRERSGEQRATKLAAAAADPTPATPPRTGAQDGDPLRGGVRYRAFGHHKRWVVETQPEPEEHHDDRGQDAAGAYAGQSAELGAIASMSRKGCRYDNAPMERFFHTLKVELIRQHRWNTHDEARRELFAYIDDYYNRQRIHSAIGYVTPGQAEQMAV
jgi:transposase InsO family protein